MITIDELKEKKIAIYGIGGYFKKNIKYLDTVLNIACFIDSNEAKWHMQPLEDGRLCISLAEAKKEDVEYVIISIKNTETVRVIEEKLCEVQMKFCHIDKILRECVAVKDELQIKEYDASDSRKKFGSVLEAGKIARYVECYMTKQACNMRCSYCFVEQSRELAQKAVPLLHQPEFIAKALSKERLGGTSLISICCDGEPLISEDMVLLIRLLLEEGHYVYLISNGTLTQRMDMISDFPQRFLNHLFIRFSYHYFELKRLNLLEHFFGNIKKFHQAGGSFTLFLVGSESYLDEIEEVKALSLKHLGALPHVDYERNETGGDGSVLVIKTEKEVENYKKIWEDFDSEFMRFRERTDGKVTGVCNAGNWVIHLDLMSGDVSRCPVGSHLGNIYEDICAPIPFDVAVRKCPYDFCVCAPVFFACGMKEDFRDTPTFYELWNRKSETEGNWIQDSAKEFFCGKLYESYGK